MSLCFAKSMIGSRSWQLLQWGLFCIVLVILGTIITRYSGELATLSWHGSLFIPFILTSLLCILFRSLLAGELAAYFGVNLRFDEMLGLTIVATTLSESLPASADLDQTGLSVACVPAKRQRKRGDGHYQLYNDHGRLLCARHCWARRGWVGTFGPCRSICCTFRVVPNSVSRLTRDARRAPRPR